MTSIRHLLVFLIATWATGCVSPSRIGRVPDRSRLPSHEVRSNSIYLIRHGWHTSLAVKRPEISTADWPESLVFQDANFIEVGWGDEAYYCARFPDPFVLAKAAFLPSRSAIHVAGIREPLAAFFEHSQIVEIKITPSQMRKLCTFIHDSYARDEDDCPLHVAPALYGTGGIYRSNGPYYIPNTCNIWTARALTAAECPVAVPLCTVAQPLVLQSKVFGQEVKKGSTVLPVIYPFFNFDRPPSYSAETASTVGSAKPDGTLYGLRD